jgi:hypothetical protein
MATTTANFSTLLRNPNAVLEQLDDGDVVLTRRHGEPLRLSRERDAEMEHEMVSAFAQMIAATVLDEDSADLVADRLQIPFAWIEFLDEESRREFVGEFLRTARACASIARFERLAVVVANWRETATAYSLGLDMSIASLDYIPGGSPAEDPRAR